MVDHGGDWGPVARGRVCPGEIRDSKRTNSEQERNDTKSSYQHGTGRDGTKRGSSTEKLEINPIGNETKPHTLGHGRQESTHQRGTPPAEQEQEQINHQQDARVCRNFWKETARPWRSPLVAGTNHGVTGGSRRLVTCEDGERERDKGRAGCAPPLKAWGGGGGGEAS